METSNNQERTVKKINVEKQPFDWKFYLLMNPDIEAAGCPRTEKAATQHWQTYGRYEKRLAFHPDKDIFDIKYYFTRYKDVQQLTSVRDILLHWYRHGKKEGRLCCSSRPVTRKQECERLIETRLTSLVSHQSMPIVSTERNNAKTKGVCIRIITRTSRRPNAFQLCRYSVLAQKIPSNCTLCHHILFDNALDSHYVQGDIVTPVQIISQTSERDFPANLYINTALAIHTWNEKAIDWNIVLDDDDMFLDPYAMYKITEHIISHKNCSLLLWNTQMDAETILPLNKPWEHGNVPSCGFAFKANSLHKWEGVKSGDFKFFNTIIQQASDSGQVHHIQETFTALQWNPGWGERMDLPLYVIRKKSLHALCKHKISKKTDTKDTTLFGDFFNCAYVLNLLRRNDRWKNTKRRFAEYGITNVQRFVGIDGKHDPTFQIHWKRYSASNPRPPCIPSIGSLAILHSMRELIVHSRKNEYTSCIVYQDDILLCKDFRNRCITFLQGVIKAIPDWKLIYLGCTQHKWPDNLFQTKLTDEVGWYYPQGTADGAFAVAIHGDTYDNLLELIGTTRLPFDSGPLREIQRQWPTKCVCAWPYLVVADVRDSDCRESRSQTKMAKKVRWNMKDFTFD